VRLEDDRGKELDPVSDELAVARRARLARLRVGAQPPRPLARQKRRLALAHSGSDRDQRLGDRPRHELVVPRRVGPRVQTHRPLAGLAGVVPGLLARQQLGEAMRPIPVRGQAAVELAPVARPAVVTVEAHARASVLRARTGRPRLLHVFPLVGTLGNHEARAGAGQNAQLDATGAPRARAARPSGGCRPRVALGDRVCSGWTWVPRLGLALALPTIVGKESSWYDG
jgi:hypothetical protein